MNTPRSRISLLYLLLFAALVFFVFFNYQQQFNEQEALNLNQVAADIQAGLVARVVTDEEQLTIIYQNGEERIAQK